MKRKVRNSLYGVLVALVLLVGLDVLLALVGVGGVDRLATSRGADVVGFDPDAAYLVPSLKSRGGWRTRYMSAPGRSEVDFPAKGARERVIIVGASTARGFGSMELEERLAGAWEGAGPEVLNTGRFGYGTDRLLLILEQALERLEPDLVLFCGGDNELIEVPPARRTAHETPAAFIRHWRTFNTLLKLFGERDIWDDLRPEEFLRFSEKSRSQITYAETLASAEHLRRNLRRMCTMARESGSRLVLCTLIYNRLAAPFSSRLPDDMPAEALAELEDCRRRARNDIPDYLSPLLPGTLKETVIGGDWAEHSPPLEGVSGDLPGRRPCLGPLATQDSLAGEDPGRWGEKVWTLYRALERFHARDLANVREESLEQAERDLTRALELCPDHPQSHFELGLVKYILRRDPATVVEHLEYAADYDRAPRKSSNRINTVIREVAAEFPEVLLYDADDYFRGLMPDGLVGWEWMRDYCHLRHGAYDVLRTDLARTIAERWPGGIAVGN